MNMTQYRIKLAALSWHVWAGLAVVFIVLITWGFLSHSERKADERHRELLIMIGDAECLRHSMPGDMAAVCESLEASMASTERLAATFGTPTDTSGKRLALRMDAARERKRSNDEKAKYDSLKNAIQNHQGTAEDETEVRFFMDCDRLWTRGKSLQDAIDSATEANQLDGLQRLKEKHDAVTKELADLEMDGFNRHTDWFAEQRRRNR